MSPNVLLLSIQRKYASMIFGGGKQVELRRVRPRHLSNGDLILVYVTSPEQALFGVLEVERVIEMPPSKLWQVVEHKAGITYEDFEKYYENSLVGFAIFLRKTLGFDPPIGIEQLKEEWLDFRPPQCYRYLKGEEFDIVQSMAKSDILSISEKPKAHQTELLLHL